MILDATDEREYRLTRAALDLGVVCAVLFAAMGIASTLSALLNLDGSFPHPIAFAVCFAIFWSCMMLLSGWLILAFFRHRLRISPRIVRITDCFRTRELRLDAVTHAAWKIWSGGILVLYAATGKVKIAFQSYPLLERSELIQFFRSVLADKEQTGWDRFEKYCPPPMDHAALLSKLRREMRFAAIAFAIATPAFYALTIWLKLTDGLPRANWIEVVLFPMVFPAVILGFIWLCARGALEQSAKNVQQRDVK